MKRKHTNRLIIASSALLAISSASAQTPRTWDGGGGDNNWSTAGNWNADTVPLSGAAITLGGSARLTNNNDLEDGFLVGGITFSNNSTAGNMTIGGNRITLGGNITATAQPGGAPFMVSTLNLAMTLNASRIINNNQRHTVSLGGVINETGGSFGITKQGSGILILAAANTFSGTMSHTVGLLTLNNSLALQNATFDTAVAPTASTGNTGNAVTGVRVGVTSLTFGGLTGGKNFTVATTTSNPTTQFGHSTTSVFNGSGGYGSVTALTLNPGAAKNLTYSGIINNGAANMTLTKTGLGTQTLSGANTYTGATTINAGTLRINGSTHTSSAFTVASGATLAGAGTVGGTVAATGSIAPGNGTAAIGTLSVSRSVTWNSGNAWQFDLASSGTSSDKLVLTGTGANGVFTKGTGDTFQFDFMGSTPAANAVFTLATFDSFSGFSAGNFSATNLAGANNTGTFTLNPTSLTFTAVPEASNMLIGGLIGLGLLKRRRKNA